MGVSEVQTHRVGEDRGRLSEFPVSTPPLTPSFGGPLRYYRRV